MSGRYITIFDDDRFGPRVWRAVVVEANGHAWCWTTRRKPDERQVNKKWRTHGRALFTKWDVKTNLPIDVKNGVI